MGEWLKKFWTDPAFFAATIRGAVATVGAGVATGIIPLPSFLGSEAWKSGIVAMAGAQFIPAGNKTPLPVQLVQGEESK